MQKIEDVFQPNLACTDSNLEKMLLHVFSTLSEELLTCIYTCGSSTDPWGGGGRTPKVVISRTGKIIGHRHAT